MSERTELPHGMNATAFVFAALVPLLYALSLGPMVWISNHSSEALRPVFNSYFVPVNWGLRLLQQMLPEEVFQPVFWLIVWYMQLYQ